MEMHFSLFQILHYRLCLNRSLSDQLYLTSWLFTERIQLPPHQQALFVTAIAFQNRKGLPNLITLIHFVCLMWLSLAIGVSKRIQRWIQQLKDCCVICCHKFVRSDPRCNSGLVVPVTRIQNWFLHFSSHDGVAISVLNLPLFVALV